MISAQLMTNKPILGEYLELQFSSSALTNTWVLFSGGNSKPWIGVFGNGHVSQYTGIARFNGTNIFLIIARGQGYIIDALDGRLLRRTTWDYSYSCLTVPEHSFVLVADTTEVWACYTDRDVFAKLEKPYFTSFDKYGHQILPEPRELHKIALDGIIFEGVMNNYLSGKCWWGQDWQGFRIDLEDMNAVIEKGIISSQWDAFLAIPDVGGYPQSKEYIKLMSSYWLE
jgi:hypothetical protein